MKKSGKIITILVALGLLCFTFPGTAVIAFPAVSHEADDALLLMLASHSMLSGDETASGIPGSAAVRAQDGGNEIDILINLYRQQVAEVDRLGGSDDVKARLLDELETKVQSLAIKSQQLEAERQSRRRGGLFGRFFRALGRATGWVVSNAMEGTGKAVQYAIEEVAPQMIKDAVFSGSPLTGAAFRAKFREMLRQRIRKVIDRKIETRLDALSSETAPSSTQPTPQQEQQTDMIPENNPPSVSAPSSCAPLEIFEIDVRKDEELSPDVIVYANGEETAPPGGFSVYYPPPPESATMSQTARVLVQDGAILTVSTDQAVNCAGVLFIGDLVTPASIYLDQELVWSGYLYQLVEEYPRPYRTFYVRFAVEPARPVSVSIIADPTGVDSLSVWVPVEAVGFDLP